jgi:nucleoside-diphosphate-sugar epimerase
MKRILVTGSQGYIGTRLCETLIQSGNFDLLGVDSGFYSETRLDNSEDAYETLQKDIRNLELEDLKKVEVIVHLAALSNDPLGEFNPSLTDQINNLAAVRLANLAKKVGCKKFVFISTQSVYGISESQTPVSEDGKKNPQTEYARSKLKAESAICNLNASNFQVYALRPATVFGYSPRFRSDIVFNNLLASAYYKDKIEIMSDGTPWRPVLFIDDLVRVITYLIECDNFEISGKPINVGLPDVNLQVKDIALSAQFCCPKASICYSNKSSRDERSYQVDFTLLKNSLPKNFVPAVGLEIGGQLMISKWKELELRENDVFGERSVRLEKLRNLQKSGLIDTELFWT